MEPVNILIGGTSKIFSCGFPIEAILPELCDHFSDEFFKLKIQDAANFLVSFNHEPQIYKAFIKSGGSSEKAILVRMEPEAVYPSQYRKRITKKYGLVITTGSPTLNEGKFFSLNWPYKYHLNPASPNTNDPELCSMLENLHGAEKQKIDDWKNRKYLVTLIAGNKVSPSFNSNYKVRRTLAKQLKCSELKIFGPLWNDSFRDKLRHRLAVLYSSSRRGTISNLRGIYGNLLRSYPNAMGEVVDKHQIMKDSQFSLIIENSNFVITEKIFDALINGSIPIYIGPDLADFGIPSEVAIEYNKKSDSILKIISETTDQQSMQFLESGRNFLLDPDFKNRWSSDSVFGEISFLIKEYISEIY